MPGAIAVVGMIPVDDAVRDTLLPLLLLVVAWPLAGIASLFWAARLLSERRWLHFIAALALPMFIAASIFLARSDFSTPVMAPALRLNQFLHFLTVKRDYDGRVAALQPMPPRLKLFVWETDPVGGSGVVYDGNDDIALPKDRRPKNWASGETKYPVALQELCRIYSVGWHYYVVSFGCDGKGI